MAKDGEKGLGKNVPLSEEQRICVLQLVKIGYKSGALQSEGAHDLVKSIRMAVDFSPEEQGIQKKRAESKEAEAKDAKKK